MADEQSEMKQQTIIPLDVVEKIRSDRKTSSGLAGASTISDEIMGLIQRMKFDEQVPLYVATTLGELAYVNEGYLRLVSNCEFTGDIAPCNGTSDKILPDSLIAILGEVQLTRRSTTVDEQIRVQGIPRYYRSRHFPICNEAGDVIAVGGTYVDCSREVQNLNDETLTQQRFRDFARATSDWYWEVDRDWKLTFISEQLTRIIGKPAFTLKEKTFEDFGDLKSGLGGAGMVCEDFMAGMLPFRSQLFMMEDMEGEVIYVHLSGVPLFDAVSGDFQGFRGAGMDVSESYKARIETIEVQGSLENTLQELTNKNIQLDMASAEAEAALGAKSDFLAAMSHELRTPLNAIIGFAEAMNLQVFGSLNEQYVSYSHDITTAGRHLLELINDVLDVAVLDSGKLNLDAEKVDLKEVIKRALSLTILRANEKNIDMSSVQVEGDVMLEVDERRTVQIFVNLLSNAVKFTPEGGRIGVRFLKVGRDKVAVTVWDTGIGIPLDQQDLVFEKFHQARDNVYSHNVEGTGLGLHISRHLAQQMGGDISLTSKPDEGSEFTAVLPLFVGD